MTEGLRTGLRRERQFAAQHTDGDVRLLSAVLRWRARWLFRRLPPEQAVAARLLPVLLQASFATPSLRKEAPGLPLLSFRRAWAGWARQFLLPPPLSMQRGRGLLDGIVALQRGEVLELLVFPSPGIKPQDRARIDERLHAARAVLDATPRKVEVRLVEEGPLPELEREACIVFGALVGGILPPAVAELRAPEDPIRLAAGLAVAAPSDVAAMALMLLAGGPGVSAGASLRRQLRAGQTARSLADPAEACVQWAGPAVGRKELLDFVLRWSRVPRTSRVERPSAFEVVEVGRALALACAAAVRRVPLGQSRPLRDRLRREVFGQGLPHTILPLLPKIPAQLELGPAERGQGYVVRLSDGAILSNGRTLMQARVRALALRALAQGPTPSGNALLDLLEVRLAKPVAVETLFVVIEHLAAPGPPFDPINRGPDRVFAFRNATALRLRPGGRPSGWRLSAAEVVRRICEAALAGHDVEVAALTPDAAPTAARLQRVAAFVRRRPSPPGALQAGGAVLFERGGRLRRLPLRRFALRPVDCTPDPEAWDLNLSPERTNRPAAGAARPNTIECRVYQVDESTGCVLSADSAGRLLREFVPLDRVEEHLRDSRDILRACVPPVMLAARLAEQLDPVLRTAHRDLVPLRISVGGGLPRALWLEIKGERFFLARTGGWRGAAETLLSHLPMGTEARISIEQVRVSFSGELAPPIFQLYARSLVLRRLGGQLVRQQAAFP